MKIKWILMVLPVMIVVLIIPFTVDLPKKFEVNIDNKPFMISYTKILVRGFGEVLLDSVLIEGNSKTFTAKKIVIRGSLLKLLKMRDKEPQLRRWLNNVTLDSLSNELLLSGLNYLSVNHLAGTVLPISVESADVLLKKKMGKFSGSLEIDKSTLFSHSLEKQKIKYELNTRIIFGKYYGKVAGGTVCSAFQYDLSQKRIVDMNVDVSKCKIAQLCPYDIDGEVSADVSAKLTNENVLVGSGTVNVARFEDNNSDILAELRRTLKLVGIKKVQFDEIEIPIAIQNVNVAVDAFSADGKLLDVTGKGQVNLRTLRYTFNLDGTLPPEMKDSIPNILWNGLDNTHEVGSKKFSGALYGVGENYSIKVDKRIFRQTARSFFKNLFN